MAAIYPEITVEWGGEEYSIKPSFGVITKIEQDVNIAALTNKMSSGDIPPLSSLAIIYARLLQSEGVKVTPEDVYNSMYGANSDAELEQEEIIKASAMVVQALVPREVKQEKKQKKSRAK